MSLIDLVARTASREELVELLRGTEDQRQKLHEALAAMVRHTPACWLLRWLGSENEYP